MCLTAFSLACGAAWAYWSAASTPGDNGASSATTVNQGATPTVSLAGSAATVSWAASTLSNGTSVSGYIVKRYDAVTPFALQTILTACTGTVTATTCTESSVPDGQWAYSVTPVFATSWTGAESLQSNAVWVDPTPPTNAISMSPISGSAVKSGDTVFFRGPVAGSFTLTNAVADADSAPASSTTSTLTGTSTGWTHSPSTVSTPAPGPYVSTAFSWTAGTTSAPTEVVTGRDLAGNTADTTLSFVNDVTGPTGGSVAASGLVGTGFLYAASTSVSVSFAKGTDPSGVAATGALLKRASATLTSTGIPDGSCGVYGAYATVTGGADPVSPKVDVVTDQACYRYQYVVTDALGNTTTYTSGDVKVDLTVPTTPTRTFGAFDSTYWSGTGNIIYYRSLAASGSFTATAVASDVKSGIAGYTFPALGTNWTSTPGALGVNTYSWSGAPAVVTAKSITATNNATKVSAISTTFTPTVDNTAPSATVSYPNGGTASTSVSVAFTGTDAGSGLATRVLQSASATLTGGTCGTFTGFSTIATNPATSPYVDTVTMGNCYKYQYVVPDNVGNQTTATSASVVKISSDVTGPTGGFVTAGGLVGTGSLYAASTSVTLTFDKGTDPSGVATTGNLLKRASAPLTSNGIDDGVCGTYGAYATVSGGTDPVSPLVNASATTAFCWKYQYLVLDTLGYATTYTSGDVKVDTTGPVVTRTFDTFTNTYWNGVSSAVYYRSNQASGSFTVTATATDPQSGVTVYTFPTTLGTNWTTTQVSPNVYSYSWSGTPAAVSAKSVTATNNAVKVGTSATFTPTVDTTAPTAGTVSYLNGTTTSTSVSVAFTTGTDAGSGLAPRLLQSASATLTGGTCGTFTGFSTIATDPATSPYVDQVGVGTCTMYQYLTPDNLGNQRTNSSASVVKGSTYLDLVNGTGGLVSYWRLGESAGTSLVDSWGTNTGTYVNAPTLGVAGAITGDTDTAATFNGSSQYGSATRQISDNFSIEFWYKPTAQGIGTGLNWYDGAGLVTSGASGQSNDFGVGLRSDGKIVAGVGGPVSDTSIVSGAAYSSGAWHHVVLTRSMATGALVLYVDGAQTGSATGSTVSLSDGLAINFGSQMSANYLSGSLDEIAVYNTVLSAATVSDHYNAAR